MYRLFFCVLVTVVFAGCGQPSDSKESEEQDLHSQMAGKWLTVGFEVNVKSYRATDEDTIVKASREDFQPMLSFTENRGEYKVDGTWEEFYYGATWRVLAKVSGTWSTRNDSVLIQQLYPEYLEREIHLELKGDTGIFTAYIDWDKDGQVDDYFKSTSLKTHSGK